MYKKKRSIIIDVDGTIYDEFKKDDNKLISRIFGDNKSVIFLDNILWFFNSLDLVTNSMGILKFRFKMYSYLSEKSFDKIEYEYFFRYQNLCFVSLSKKKELIKTLSDNYNLLFITNNSYTKNVIRNNFKLDIVYAENVKERKRIIKEYLSFNDVEYIIGNNYTDDIKIARKNKIKSIYVGNSIFRNFFRATKKVVCFKDVINIIENSSSD